MRRPGAGQPAGGPPRRDAGAGARRRDRRTRSPVVLPRDDGPHDRLTEWWYYTGHLRGEDGARFGFEYVVFRAERGGFPVTWASHLALTDETGGRFHYAQRNEIGPQVDRSPRERTASPPASRSRSPASTSPIPRGCRARRGRWRASRGTDTLSAAAAGEEVFGDPVSAFGLDLRLRETKPPALHDRDGYIDFGPAGGSYYYSRTAMDGDGHADAGRRRRWR